MDLNDTPEQAAYRERVRAWITQHRDRAPAVPSSQGVAGIPPADPELVAALRRWQSELARGGLAGVAWPVEYGGQGLSPIEQKIALDELTDAGLPGIGDQASVGWLGPTLISFGSEAQKQRYLSPMLHAEEFWVQLFSEPAAGSDLAAIRTKASREHDGRWRISGQKVWITNAHLATLGMMLARTDPSVPKHKGLTMFIVPMTGPGVTVRPLRQITGESEFSEVFFDDVIVESDATVGAVGGGWSAALAMLMHERLTLSLRCDGPTYRPERFLYPIAQDDSARADPLLRQRFGALAIQLMAIRFTGYRLLTGLQRGQIPGPEAALNKLTMDSAAIGAVDVILDALGPQALAEAGEWSYLSSYLPAQKNGGGAEPILRNTIAERLLGLPPEPRLDKDRPFAEMERPDGRSSGAFDARRRAGQIEAGEVHR